MIFKIDENVSQIFKLYTEVIKKFEMIKIIYIYNYIIN